MNRNFKERIQPHDKNNIMGIDEYIKMVGKEEGIAEGRMEEKTEIVKRLLADKEFSIKKIATITGVSVDFVKTLKSGLPAK
jgi:predicted transposase/invertase (TIGR01784 family)